MPIYLETDNHLPIFPDDYATQERHEGLLRDVPGATRPDDVAIFLGRVIAGLFIALAVLGCYLKSQGVG